MVLVVNGFFGRLCALLFLIHVHFDGGHLIVYNVLFCTFLWEARAPLEISMFSGSQESFFWVKAMWHGRTDGIRVCLHNYTCVC